MAKENVMKAKDTAEQAAIKTLEKIRADKMAAAVSAISKQLDDIDASLMAVIKIDGQEISLQSLIRAQISYQIVFNK